MGSPESVEKCVTLPAQGAQAVDYLGLPKEGTAAPGTE